MRVYDYEWMSVHSLSILELLPKATITVVAVPILPTIVLLSN